MTAPDSAYAAHPPLEFEENVPLAPLTTLGVGGPALFLCRIGSEEQIGPALRFAEELGGLSFVLGGGSNTLISDYGYPGLILRMDLNVPLARKDVGDLVYLTASAGMDWDALVLAACEAGLCGIECLAGIPGLVGGTPVQNVGAYGQEVAETITEVRAFDRQTKEFVSLAAAECGFSYRHSIFNSSERGRYLVTAVTFRLRLGDSPKLTYADLSRHFGDAKPTPLEVYHAVRSIRAAKGMLLVAGDPDCRSAGSFFKNPIVPPDVRERVATAPGLVTDVVPAWPAREGQLKLPAAWLLERAGFVKGYAKGQAGISSRHTLALINRGGATAADIVALRDEIVATVQDKFGIMLEQEPVMLGFHS